MSLVPATYSCAPIGRRLSHHLGPYTGYSRPDQPERPLFTKETARRIMEDWKALPRPETHAGEPYDAHFNSQDRSFRFYDAERNAWYVWKGEEVGVAALFPIGEGAWKWECHG